jgi:hypothetical protein
MTSFTRHDPVRRRALAHRFAVLDPATTPADIAVAREAMEYVRDESLDDETRLLWGRWAYHTLLHVRGAQHPMLLEYSIAYETILRSQGLTFDAYRISTARLDAVTRTGNRSMILNASLAVALALHGDGQCRAAAHALDTLSTARNLSANADDDARAVIAVQAVIYVGCGLTAATLRLLHRGHRRLHPQQVDELAHRLTDSEAEHPPCMRTRGRPLDPATATAILARPNHPRTSAPSRAAGWNGPDDAARFRPDPSPAHHARPTCLLTEGTTVTQRRRGDTDGNAPPTAAGNGGIGYALLATGHLLVAVLFAVAGWRWIPHDRPFAMTGAGGSLRRRHDLVPSFRSSSLVPRIARRARPTGNTPVELKHVTSARKPTMRARRLVPADEPTGPDTIAESPQHTRPQPDHRPDEPRSKP